MINVKGLYHSYSKDGKYAVQNANFKIKKGEVFGFLGPSGAGKSTTQGVLTGLLPIQQGEVTIGDFNIRNPKKEMFNIIGVSFEQANIYDKLTAYENLNFYRKLFDVKTRDPNELLEMVGLDHVADKKSRRIF